MSSNPSVRRESTPRTSPRGRARSRSSSAIALAGVAALIATMAAGVLAGPGDSNILDNREHGFRWEMFGASAWLALPDDGPTGIVGAPHVVELQSGIESDYEFVLVPGLGLAMDINNQRQIVGLDELSQGGVLIDGDVITPINFPGAVFTQPTNINERGEIIGHYRPDGDSPLVGFHRDVDGEFTTIAYPGADSTSLWGFNDPGDIVGHFVSNDTQTAFILDRDGEFAILDLPGDGNSTALGINNAGTISGWFVDEGGLSNGYLLERDGVSVINYPGAFSSDVGRVNEHGDFNGTHFNPPLSIGSFVWTEQGGFVDFSFPGYDITLIRGINDRGDQSGSVLPDFASPPQGFVAFHVIAGDVDGDGAVGVGDLMLLLQAWGDCPAPPETCPADFDDDGSVGMSDLLLLLAHWLA